MVEITTRVGDKTETYEIDEHKYKLIVRVINGIADVPVDRLRLIRDEVARYLLIKVSDMERKIRKRPVVYARQVYCYLARTLTVASLKGIGEIIGARDHTTVLHSINTMKDLIFSDPVTRSHIEELEIILHGSALNNN